MELITNTTDFQMKEPTAVAVGKFDGLHLGHRVLLERILEEKGNGLKSAVFTFDPSPAAYFSSAHEGFRELMTREEKRGAFERMGVDYLVEYPFGKETAAVTPEEYVNHFLLEKMQARLIVAGEDVSFGKNGAGDATLLKTLVAEHNERKQDAPVSVSIIPKICFRQRPISSTLVRSVVSEGDLEHAALLLTEPFSVTGVVEKGRQLGRSMQMPTANLYPPEGKLLPPNGVYFSLTRLGDRTLRGITNVGFRPTVREGERRISVENHLFDFDEDIYGETITVQMLHFRRSEQRFADLKKLQAQMAKDVEACKRYFASERFA